VVARLPVFFTRRAGRQIDDAMEWWRQNRSKAPNALAEDIDDALDVISANPGVGAIARNVRLARLRRVFLHRVSYYLYYRVHGSPAKRIEVVAFWHSRRGATPRI